MPTSKGKRVVPWMASEGIHDNDVTEFSYLMGHLRQLFNGVLGKRMVALFRVGGPGTPSKRGACPLFSLRRGKLSP
jgi:hypothetical protein